MDYSVIPECYVDTNLIETLVPEKGGYNHQKGCGTVARTMKGRQLGDGFALGIIDKDKKELDYLNEFRVVTDIHSLILYKHPQKHHYIIQICPAMEQFIIENAKDVDVILDEYDLPTDLDQLKKASKTVNSQEDIRFKNLFKALKRKGAPGMMTLAAWVGYLRNNNYTADMEVLKGL